MFNIEIDNIKLSVYPDQDDNQGVFGNRKLTPLEKQQLRKQKKREKKLRSKSNTLSHPMG